MHTPIMGLITDASETAYRDEVNTLALWCRENNLALNAGKTKELIVDFRRPRREHTPIYIDGVAVERVSQFKFLGMHIDDDLKWTTHTTHVVKKAQQRLYCLRRLNKFNVSPRILRSFYNCTIESILTGGIAVWYGSCTTLQQKALQRVVRSAQRTVGGELPSLQGIYERRCMAKAEGIAGDIHHPGHSLFQPVLRPRPGKRYRSLASRTQRLWNTFFLAAIRLMNAH